MTFFARSVDSVNLAVLVGSLALLLPGCWGPLGSLDFGEKVVHGGGSGSGSAGRAGGTPSGAGGNCGATGPSGCGIGGATSGVDISKLVVPGASPGACLLEYNSAFVATGADSCCFQLGGPNRCNLDVRCNDASGGDCCLFYATDNISFGQGCCHYATGRTPFSASGEDVSVPCRALLSAGR
jgi:hypothetical protein